MTAAQIKQRIPRRWVILAAIAATMMVGGTVLAVHDNTGPMELDGNIADANGGGTDWQAIFNASGNQTANVPAGTLDTTGVIRDFIPGATGPDISYHEPSNKDDQAIGPTGATWGCVSAANPTDKTDIVNAYGMAVQGDGPATGDGDGDTADDQLFYFGVERFDNSGDAFIGLWLFQDDVGCTADGKFVGSKRTGDILVLSNFTGGGATASIQLFRYTAGAGTNPGTFADLVTVTGKCENTNTGDLAFPQNDICATINDTNTFVTPWAMEDKIKPGPPSPDPVREVDPDQFVEGGVNITDIFAGAGLGAPPCFGSFLAETRSSSSLSATLKDYALGDLNFCDARVKIDQSATNRVGTPHTFVVDVEQQLGAGYVAAPTGNVDVTLTGSDGIVAGDITIIAAQSTCDDAQPAGNNLDAAGQCTLTVNSTETGKITANATVSVNVGGSPLVRDTLSTTTTIGSGYDPESGPAVKTYVDATIDITGDDSNRVGDAHLFTATVKKDFGDGNGFVAAAGQVVAVTLANSNNAVAVVDNDPETDTTCDTGTNASGQCVVKFTSATTGVVTGTAATTVSFASGALTFGITSAADAATVGNEDATKVFVDATIDITGDDANPVDDPHLFTVTVKKDIGDNNGFVAAASQVVAVTLTNSNSAAAVVDDTPETDTTCDDGTNASGQCVVKFSSATTGITTGTASTTVSFGNNLSFSINTTNDAAVVGNEDATKKWVNARIGIVGTDTNSIEEDHTFTVTLQKDLSASGGYVAADGEQVDVTLTDAGAVHILDTALTTCDVSAESHDGTGTNASGQCVVVFTSNTAGTVTASATATLTVETVSMTVNTGDATSTTAATVVKTFVDGSIRWLKHDGDGNLLGGATFEVCRTATLDSSDGSYDVDDPAVCFTILDNDATDDDNTAGELQVNDLILGKYTVKETIPPLGYHIQLPPGAGPFNFPAMSINPLPSVLDVNMADGTTGGVANPPAFVNIKAFRIIVITCDDITDTLVDGTVNLDPAGTFDSTKATISAADLVTLGWKNSGGTALSESDFCNQGGASFGDLPENTYNATIELPDRVPHFPL